MVAQVLNVFLYNELTGKLSYENGVLSFSYDKDYLEKEIPLGLSASLPLQPEPFSHSLTEAFFAGLLPEDLVRKRLTRYLGISEKNTFGLLQEIGGECAGAVSVYPQGTGPNTEAENAFRILEEDEAFDIMGNLDKHPFMAGEDDIRLSGAGAQDKMIVSIIKGKLAIPLRNTPSTHIIKPMIKGLDYTVHNEFFCMKLAQRVGLPVPNVEIFYIKHEPYYLVERYDRRPKDDRTIERLHQEDFCQALHIPPEQKYENEGGPTLVQCFDLLDRHIKAGRMAGINRLTFLKGIIFNFLIGNGDAHGKNFSLLYEGEAESLTPFYDLLCTLVYNNAYKSRMAMKIGGKYKFSDVASRHFERLGDEASFKSSFIKSQINKLAVKTESAALILLKDLNRESETSSPIYEQIVDVIKSQCKKLI